MNSGITIGDAALHRLQGGFSGTIWEATDALEGLTGTKDELLEAVAYLALQTLACRSKSDEGAHLALMNVRTVLNSYDDALSRSRKGCS